MDQKVTGVYYHNEFPWSLPPDVRADSVKVAILEPDTKVLHKKKKNFLQTTMWMMVPYLLKS